MPLYDYACQQCQTVTEFRHGFREPFSGTCPACGSSDLKRKFSAAPIIFNGSGFYVTDSRKGTGSDAGSSSTSTPAATPSTSSGDKPAGSAA